MRRIDLFPTEPRKVNDCKPIWIIVMAAKNIIGAFSVSNNRHALPKKKVPRWQFTLKLRVPNRRLLGIRYEPAFRKSVWESGHFLENVIGMARRRKAQI